MHFNYSVLDSNLLTIGNLFLFQNELIMLEDWTKKGDILSLKYVLSNGKAYPWTTLTLTMTDRNNLKPLHTNIQDIDLSRFEFIPDEKTVSGYAVKIN